jgi:hypothetical protein
MNIFCKLFGHKVNMTQTYKSKNCTINLICDRCKKEVLELTILPSGIFYLSKSNIKLNILDNQ